MENRVVAVTGLDIGESDQFRPDSSSRHWG